MAKTGITSWSYMKTRYCPDCEGELEHLPPMSDSKGHITRVIWRCLDCGKILQICTGCNNTGIVVGEKRYCSCDIGRKAASLSAEAF